MEGQATDAIENGGTAPEQARLAAEDDVVVVSLDVLLQAHHFGELFAQQLDDLALVGQSLRGRHEADHEVALLAHAAHDVAQHAAVAVLIVDGDAQLRHDLAHGVHDFVVALGLNAAVARVDNLVAALRKAANDGLALDAAHGELHLVAVIPGMHGAERRMHRQVGPLADARHGIDDLLALRLELGFIIEVLQLAAAAGRVDRAGRLHAVLAGLEDVDEGAARIGLLCLGDARLDIFAGQCAHDKYREALITPHALAARAEAVDMDAVCFSFFDGNFRFHTVSFVRWYV